LEWHLTVWNKRRAGFIVDLARERAGFSGGPNAKGLHIAEIRNQLRISCGKGLGKAADIPKPVRVGL
jgi:hypothetical protein